MRDSPSPQPSPRQLLSPHSPHSPKDSSLSESESRVTYRAYAFATPKTEGAPHLYKVSDFHVRWSGKPSEAKDLRNLLQISSISRNMSQSSVQKKQRSSLFANRKLNSTIDCPQQETKMIKVAKSEARVGKQNENEKIIQPTLKVKYLKVEKCTNLSLEGKSCSLKQKKPSQVDFTNQLIELEQQINKSVAKGEAKASTYKGKSKLKITQNEEKKSSNQKYQEKPKEFRSSLHMEGGIDFELIHRKLVQNMQRSRDKQNINPTKSPINLQKKSIASLNSSVLHKSAQQNPKNHPDSSTVFNIKYQQSFTKKSLSRLHEITFCQMTSTPMKPRNRSKRNDNSILNKYKKRGKCRPSRDSSQTNDGKQPCLLIEEVEINRKSAKKVEHYTSTKESFSIEPFDFFDNCFTKSRQQSTKFQTNSHKNYLRPKSSVQRRR